MKKNLILLIDDNDSDVELTRRALQKAEIEYTLAVLEDGREAVQYLFGSAEPNPAAPGELPDLVILDLNLPMINGIEVLRRLRKNPRTRHLMVVIMSTSLIDSDVTTCYELGANSYIRKPIDYKEFVADIQLLARYWLEVNVPVPLVEG
jgi:two-component system, response regulator